MSDFSIGKQYAFVIQQLKMCIRDSLYPVRRLFWACSGFQHLALLLPQDPLY